MTGVGPKVDANAFDDLLGSHKFTPKEEKPTTLKGMKNVQLAEDMDPNKLKVLTSLYLLLNIYYSVLTCLYLYEYLCVNLYVYMYLALNIYI